MPKGFTEHEKAQIQAALLAKGRELFGLHGVRKTNVEDLTRAVGISKGAFYLFYDSKETLFFTILQQFEADYRQRMLDALAPGPQPVRTRVQLALRQAVTLWRAHPLFAQLASDDLAYLTRKLSPEQLQAGVDDDIAFSSTFLAACRAAGLPVTADPRLVTGLLRALVLLNLHEQEIGTDIFPEVIDVLVAQIVSYLVEPTA